METGLSEKPVFFLLAFMYINLFETIPEFFSKT
jgi:hypothetical protein